MRPAGKMLIGILLLIGGGYWYAQDLFWGTGLTNLESLLVGFKGGFGVILLLVGVLIVWIESDEIRLEQELEKREQQRSQPRPEEETRIDEEDATGFTCGTCGNTYDTERGLHIHQTRSHEQ